MSLGLRTTLNEQLKVILVLTSTEPTTASHENLPPNDVLHDNYYNDDDDGESFVDPSAHSRETKKKVVDTRKKKDITALLKQSIVNHKERAKQRAL